MRRFSLQLEEMRWPKPYTVHERHRVFPAVFEKREHTQILELGSSAGQVAQRIQDNYPADLLCNEVSPTCLRMLRELGASIVSFDFDDDEVAFPFCEGCFDAVVALDDIAHVIHTDYFLEEIHRILSKDGYLYISSPNYASLFYLSRFLLSGKTFHDPVSESSRYEFYTHFRYFTYRTLLEFVSTFGFVPDTVYVGLPGHSTFYRSLYSVSKARALAFRYAMMFMYKLSARWAPEPIVCFRKSSSKVDRRFRKVIL